MTQTGTLGVVIHSARPFAQLVVLASCAGTAFAQYDDRAEQAFANYSFAHELGAGVYEHDGRLLQIYRLPFEWRYREASADRAGITLLLPATLGFLDFTPFDVAEAELPDRIDSLSFVPGIELEFTRGEQLRIRPFAKVGVALASQAEVGGTLYSLGVYNEYLPVPRNGWQGRLRSDLLYSGVNYRGSLPSDRFVRWRQGAEGVRGLGYPIGRHELESGLFGVLDWYVDPPTGPVTGVDVPSLQFEAGVMFGLRPAFKWRRVTLPRVGLSYRFAGDVSGWRLVFGAPF